VEFYKQFLQTGGPQGERTPAIHLAIFGKHPGWDDHIPDTGLSTDTLFILKRVLYVRGIGGLIDAGAWDNLPPEDVLDGFHHTFVGQRGGDAVIGRMWPSKDGKGRARYPMVVAAHLVAVPLEKSLARVLGVLEEFRAGCREAQSDEAVLALLAAAQQTLNGLAAEQAAAGDVYVPARRVLKRMLEREPLSDAVQHRRLLYEISNKLEPFSSAKVDKAALDDSHAGEHIRLPMTGFKEISEGFLGWLTYLRTQVSARIPLLLIVPEEGDWVDAIAGLFSGQQLRCLRASEHQVPCVTGIEYNIPADFAERVEPLLTGLADWEQAPNEKSVFGPPPRLKLTQRVAHAANRMADQASGTVRHPLVSKVLDKLRARPGAAMGAAAAVIGLAAIMLVILPGSCSSSDEPPQSAARDPQRDAPVAVEGVPAGVTEAWSYLSRANEWYPRLFRYARNPAVRAEWGADPELGRLIERVDDPELARLLDAAAAVTNLVSAELASLDPGSRQAMTSLAASVREIENLIRGWSVPRHAVAIKAAAQERGWERLSAELDRIAPALQFNRDLGKQIQDQLEFAAPLRRAGEALARNRQQVERLASSGLPGLSGIAGLNARALGDVPSLALLNDALAQQEALLQRLEHAVLADRGALDQALAAADPRHADTSGDPVERLRRLASLFEDYQLIDAAELPEFDVEKLLSRGQLAGQLDTLAGLDPEFNPETYRQRWEDAAAQLAEVARMPRVRMNQRAIAAAHKQAADRLTALRSELGRAIADRADPSGWAARLPELAPEAPAVADAWKRRLARVVPQADLAVLAADSGAYVARRQLVDQWLDVYQETGAFLDGLRLPPPESGSRAAYGRHDAIQRMLNETTTGVLVEFVDRLDRPLADDPAARQAFTGLQQAVRDDLFAPMVTVLAELTRLEAALHGDGAGSFDELFGLVEQFWPEGPPTEDIGDLLQAARDLHAVRTAGAIGPLLETFERNAWPGVRWAVWRRIPQLDGWPGSRAELEQARDLGSRMLVHGLTEAQQEDALRLFWQRAMMAAPGRDQRHELWDFHGGMDWTLDQLPDPWRYDALVCGILKTPVSGIGHDEALVIRDRFIQSLQSLGEVAGHDAVRRFIADLGELTFEQGRRIDPELLARAGPAAAGWELQDADPSGAWAVYAWPSDNLSREEGLEAYTLSFALVESAAGDRHYMGADEVSAGLFFDWMDEQAGWDGVQPHFPPAAIGSDQPQRDIEWRRGPRGWTLGNDQRLIVAFDWQLLPNTQGVPLPPGLNQRPTRLTPVNYIAAPAAQAWAAGMGCRLPSPAEFAVSAGSPLADLADPNLRDAAWARHLSALVEQSGTQLISSWPDMDCFAPQGLDFPRNREAWPATSADDGVLFFRESGGAQSGPVRLLNLRGNLAEYLVEPPSGRFMVAGGSAVSPAELDWETPYPVDAAQLRGFSDVGFRLAFDAPVPLPGRILLEAIAGAPDLPLR
jgi:hypothetical protein